MNKAIKRIIIFAGMVAVLVVGAMVLVPMVVDVKQYKPKIEALVAQQTGRTFAMGEDIRLSVFPWVGVRLSDLVLGNAQGFKAEPMVRVKSFEVRVKVMPLLKRQIEVDSFVLDSPGISLEKNRAGRGNWEGIGPAGQPAEAQTAGSPAAATQGLPLASLNVGRFAIVNGTLSYVDAGSGMEKSLSDLNLELRDISLDRPMTLSLKALADGKPVSVSGQAGPLGRNPGKEDLNLDLAVSALDTLALTLKGSLKLTGNTPGLDARIQAEPFSPRSLFEKLGQPFPVQTRDPKAMDKLAFKAGVKASAQVLDLSSGVLVLDDSNLTFTARIQEFGKPDIRFDLDLDQMDLDRYLPRAQAQEAAGAGQAGIKPMDYTPLRRLVLEGKARIGTLKAANLTLTQIRAEVKAKNGVFNADPLALALYQGTANAKALVDVTGQTPKTQVHLNTQGVQAGPLVRDGAGKDIIEGALTAALALAMTGDTPAQIRQSLGGKGELTFTDGAIKGVDIAGAIRDAASGLGLAQKPTEKPRTDFAELKVPYTADQGLVTIPGASLVSPLLRLNTSGNTHLVREDLDFRIEPKLVATLKGQGDTKDRSGLLIPLLVKGTWTDPKIRPDLEGMVKGKLTDPSAVKALIQGQTESGQPTEDKAKSLIKGLLN